MDDLIMGDLIEKGMVCIPRSKLLALSNFIQHSSNSFTEVEWCRHGITSGLRYMSQSSGCVSLLPANLEQVLSTEKYTVGISKNVSHPANLEFERLQWVSHHQYITFAEHYDLGFFNIVFPSHQGLQILQKGEWTNLDVPLDHVVIFAGQYWLDRLDSEHKCRQAIWHRVIREVDNRQTRISYVVSIFPTVKPKYWSRAHYQKFEKRLKENRPRPAIVESV